MINFSNLALIKEGIAAIETLMKLGGIPAGAKLKHVHVKSDGLLFVMKDGSEWKATVSLAKVR